jgi:hypothetical protein
MRLCEHEDFGQAIQRAATHFAARGLRPAIVEKDYYVTEALRELARHSGDRISRAHFPRDYACPEGMDFSKSEALFPPADLSARLAVDYAEQCGPLCYGEAPTWQRVLARFEELRTLLGGA